MRFTPSTPSAFCLQSSRSYSRTVLLPVFISCDGSKPSSSDSTSMSRALLTRSAQASPSRRTDIRGSTRQPPSGAQYCEGTEPEVIRAMWCSGSALHRSPR